MVTAARRWLVPGILLAAFAAAPACASRTPRPELQHAAIPHPRPALAKSLARRPLRPSTARASRGQPAAQTAPFVTAAPAAELPAISIVMDDLGDRHAAGLRTLALPAPVACAFLPLTPFARAQAQAAHALGREVLVHLPLEPRQGIARLTPVSITQRSGADDLVQRVRLSLASVPHASGVNNHQGSLLTASRSHMDWLMKELRASGGLYFVDSRTTGASVAYDTARRHGLAATARNVFLDDVDDEALIREQWLRLIRIARARGTALAIGHPRPLTFKVLEEELPRLAELGVRMVPPSELIRLQGGDKPLPLRLQLAGALAIAAAGGGPASR